MAEALRLTIHLECVWFLGLWLEFCWLRIGSLRLDWLRIEPTMVRLILVLIATAEGSYILKSHARSLTVSLVFFLVGYVA
jgi:hypothetical protein